MTSFQDDLCEIMDLALAIRRVVGDQDVQSPELQSLMHDIDTVADAAWCYADSARTKDPKRGPTYRMFAV